MTVKYHDIEILSRVSLNEDFIFSFTFIPGYSLTKYKSLNTKYLLVSWVKKMPDIEKQNGNHSEHIRKYIQQVFLDLFKVETRIYRKFNKEFNVYMPPYLYYKKEFYPISLSHHGRYLMFSLAMKPSFFKKLILHYDFSDIVHFENFIIIFQDK